MDGRSYRKLIRCADGVDGVDGYCLPKVGETALIGTRWKQEDNAEICCETRLRCMPLEARQNGEMNSEYIYTPGLGNSWPAFSHPVLHTNS